MMKKRLFALLVAVSVLCGCAARIATPSALQASHEPKASSAADLMSPAHTAFAALSGITSASLPVLTSSPAALPERTPDPAAEMLVTGTVTALLDNAIQVKADNQGRDLVITMLDRADYAGGVPKQFKVGNVIRIITSNKLAKTLPERVAAKAVLQNS